MNFLKNSSGLPNEFVSQDVSTLYSREIIITSIRAMINGKSPDVLSVPNPGFASALTGILARYTDGLAYIQYYFQGQKDTDISTDLVLSAQGSVASEPITSHPKIGSLIQNYSRGLVSGQVAWVDYLPNNVVNPFSNVDSYLYPSISYGITQSFSSPPDLRISQIGKLAQSSIFGTLPQVASNFNWLYAGADIEQYGAVFRITCRYLKSAPGGWQSDIYS